MRLPYIESVDDWDRLFAGKQDTRDLVVFKVSSICGMSFRAEEEVAAWLRDVDMAPEVDVYKVDVHSGRPVSNLIEEQLGIRHESPQILWIGGSGTVRWHGSHRAITRDRLATLYAERSAG